MVLVDVVEDVCGFVCVDDYSRNPLCMGFVSYIENWAIQGRHFPKLIFLCFPVLGRHFCKA